MITCFAGFSIRLWSHSLSRRKPLRIISDQKSTMSGKPLQICFFCLFILLRTTAPETFALAAQPDDRAGNAARFLSTVIISDTLQEFLETTVATLIANDRSLQGGAFQAALIDLSQPQQPRMAHVNGDQRVYPASVVKFIYLIAAYQWAEENRIVLDTEWQHHLRRMIRHSDNQSTRWMVYRLTGTEPGPELPPEQYARFRENRLAVKRWLTTMGLDNLHCVHPTYDGNGDLFGRDLQFMRDRSFQGETILQPGGFPNRLSVTALDITRLLALLATGHLLSPEDTEAVLKLMKRDIREQKYLERRIAGGASRISGLDVYSKSGTYRETFADVGIVKAANSKQLVLAVFIQNQEGYRGNFIADLTERCARYLLGPDL